MQLLRKKITFLNTISCDLNISKQTTNIVAVPTFMELFIGKTALCIHYAQSTYFSARCDIGHSERSNKYLKDRLFSSQLFKNGL